MKKVFAILSVFALFALVSVLSSCGGGAAEVKEAPTTGPITFEFAASAEYEVVNVAGEFQGWNPSDPNWLMEDIDGKWVLKDVELDPGVYKFKFCPEGAWGITSMQDIAAEVAVTRGGVKLPISFVDDGFGGLNAQIEVK